MKNSPISTKTLISARQSARDKEYWLNNLSGNLVKNYFFYDYNEEGETGEYTRETVEFLFPAEIHAKLNRLKNKSDRRLHMILTAAVLVLMGKYTGSMDIIIGVPVYKQNTKEELINTVLPLRNKLENNITFKELLLQVRQTITAAAEHANYPIQLLPELLNLPYHGQGDFPLFDVSVLLENIHDKGYLQHINHPIMFSFLGKEMTLGGTVVYNPLRCGKETVQRMIGHLTALLGQVLSNVDLPVSSVEILSKDEKRLLLYEFNDTATNHSPDQSIHLLFAEQVQRHPGQTAVSFPLDPKDMFTAASCFNRNAYIYESPEVFWAKPGNPGEKIGFHLLKTHCHNSALVNTPMLKLLRLFDGQNNIGTIFSSLVAAAGITDIRFIIYSAAVGDLLGITHDFNCRPTVFSNMKFQDFMSLVELLAENRLIELAAVKPGNTGLKNLPREYFLPGEPGGVNVNTGIPLKELLEANRNLSLTRAEVLLLGDTPGMPTTGLLYLASYLRRNGVKAICRFYNGTGDLQYMKDDMEKLLEAVKPGIVAISMKWFLYAAHVLEMCKIVKEYSAKTGIHVKVVVGGDTASYYREKVIENEYIDYVIYGDGELPLLKISQGAEAADVPNCVYKKNGRITHSPLTYIKNETNSPEIYLSHLDEILITGKVSLFGSFFIYTHQGCEMNCFYCGGCRRAQKRNFNREKVFIRPVREVRKDILEALPYTSTFQFDFDTAQKNLFEYCRGIWEGIDLSGHFCSISILRIPGEPLIQLAARTFKYVYWDIDVLTLSERHRMELYSLGLVKPQPTDAEILAVLDRCDNYHNVEIRLNAITGLPCFSVEDIEIGERFISTVMTRHRSFGELHWARLHAQPGAPVIKKARDYNMHAFAAGFEDFLAFSKQNLQSGTANRGLENLNYPYVYFNDDTLNSKITLHYSNINQKIRQHRENRRTARMPNETLTYEELNEKANQLAYLLKSRGVTADTIVGLMLPPSMEIPAAILGVLKAGGAYLPIDPDYPQERINYMLADSGAKILVSKVSEVSGLNRNVEIIDLCRGEPLCSPGISFHHSSFKTHHSGLAYIIYTSGTTGKPKGTLLTHRNLVNYVYWFARTVKLTPADNALLTSSFAFDLGYTSIYPPLLTGAGLHIIPRETYLAVGRLLNYIRANRITYLKVTPSLFSVILQAPEFSPATCGSLRWIVMGGEPIRPGDVEKAHRIYPGTGFINHYGPTEATIGCIAACIDFGRFEEFKKHPVIGKPIDNTQVYIPGKDSHILPVGVPGELCISGACLARGYLNQPDLTHEKFGKKLKRAVISHSSLVNGESKSTLTTNDQCLMTNDRLYKTGDLARWLPDGTLEFLGRIDKQVKIRGFRVELEEIKNTLLTHNQIKEALVINRQNPGTDNGNFLCAYFTPRREQPGKDNKKVLHLEDIIKNEKSTKQVKGIEGAPTVTRRFEECAAKFPHSNALEYRDRAWTYEALDHYANRVAHAVLEAYDDRYKLSKSERERYKRQMLLHGWGQASQEKLKSTTVFVAGAGGGGSAVIMQLALLGFGTIRICDFDVVELSNLNRQFLHNENRIGIKKTLSAQQAVSQINPHVKVIPLTEKLTGENVYELVGDSAIIFDMFDGPGDKFILSRYAAAAQIPHVIISMADINAYTAVFHPPHTPCYHCIFSKKKLETLTAGMQKNVENYRKNPLAVAIPSLFTSTGTAVNEAVKILLGLEQPAYNKFFYFNPGGPNQELRYTPSYQSMTHLFSDFFRKICKQQGFDWDVGWRGNFLEVLEMEPDPGCPICSENRSEKPLLPARELKKQTAAVTANTKGHLQTAALLVDNHTSPASKAAAVLGILKAGKTYVPLDPHFHGKEERLGDILEDSEARVILTDDKNREKAEKLRDKVNKAIPILNLKDIGETVTREKPKVEIKADDIAYILYPPFTPDSTGPAQGITESHVDILNFINRCTNPLPSHSLSLYHYPFKTSMVMLLAGLLHPETPFPMDFDSKQDQDLYPGLSTQLREYLSKKLPDYMIPSYFIQLDRIPLTPNGKIDYNALPEPASDVSMPGGYIPPQDKFEEKLVRLWSEVLGIEENKVGVETNFFELGGDSLSLISLLSSIYKEFGIEISITQVFNNPVIREISKFIEGNSYVEEPVLLLNKQAQKKMYCFPPGVGFGIAYKEFAARIDNCAVYSFNFIEDEARMTKYVEIIKGLQPKGPYVLFGFSAAGGLVFDVANALQNHGCEVSDIILADCFWKENKENNTDMPDFDQEDNGFIRYVEKRLTEQGLDFVKERVKQKMESYQQYNQNLNTFAVIHANVHQIFSEVAREKDITTPWKKYTGGSLINYHGFGRHAEMLSPGPVEKNAAIIREILNRIQEKGTPK